MQIALKLNAMDFIFDKNLIFKTPTIEAIAKQLSAQKPGITNHEIKVAENNEQKSYDFIYKNLNLDDLNEYDDR